MDCEAQQREVDRLRRALHLITFEPATIEMARCYASSALAGCASVDLTMHGPGHVRILPEPINYVPCDYPEIYLKGFGYSGSITPEQPVPVSKRPTKFHRGQLVMLNNRAYFVLRTVFRSNGIEYCELKRAVPSMFGNFQLWRRAELLEARTGYSPDCTVDQGSTAD